VDAGVTGSFTLTVTVSNSGCTNSCQLLVTVADSTPPIAVCQDVTVQLDGTGNATIIPAQIDNGSTDDCLIASLSLDQTSFDCSNVGANTVTLTVTDASGNTATCTATVTVVDNQAPTIICPADISQDNDANNCGAIVNYIAPVGADNCSGATTAQTAGLASGSLFPVGVTTNTFVVTDAAGNTATCSFTVTVSDAQPPAIVCPADITQNTDANACGAT